MPSFQIPTKEKRWIQPNRGDVFGNLWASFNLDFETRLGKVLPSRRMVIRTDSTDDTDLGVPWGFLRTSADATDRWWAGCGAVLFKNPGTDPNGIFTQDTAGSTDASSPADLTAVSSDIVEFNSNMVVSRSTDLARLVAGTWKRTWWTDTVVNGGLAQTALTTGIAHPLHTSLKTNVLCIGDGNLLHTVDKNSNVKASRVILPTEFEIIWIRSTYDGTWIGARNKSGEAKVFFWDESAENYNRSYGLKDEMTFAGVIKDGIPYTVNGTGQLLKFTGSGFEEVAVFPVFGQINKRLNDGNTVKRNINRNGMAIVEGKIHINISSTINNTFGDSMENFPSGVWTYDETQGLRHKYALSLWKLADATELDYGGFILPEAGALVATNTVHLFLAGCIIGSSATANINVISYPHHGIQLNTRGHFITSIFESSAFEDIFKDILLTFKRFKNSGDRIIIKYRTIKNINYPIGLDFSSGFTGTWTSTTVFTSTADLANALAGDEVMILRGRGGGAIPKISSISFATPTYTVTLAEAVTGVSGTMKFIISDWTEAAIISTQGIERQGFDLDVSGTFIQLKIELRSVTAGVQGTGDSPELEKIIINSTAEAII